jgi:hypothetical protein
MRYVVLRDDDTNALTPVECLERLYRPFFKRNLPINLAVIPAVSTAVKMPDGTPEGFLLGDTAGAGQILPIGTNRSLTKYILGNPNIHIAHHGCHHEYFEFDLQDPTIIVRKLDEGTRCLNAAGFAGSETFVAPYDKISRASYRELLRRFRVISTGWFELRRLPPSLWPKYALAKFTKKPHLRTHKTFLLSHPGCLLSCHRSRDQMFQRIRQTVESNSLTVLVTHWWEYSRNNKPDEPFISVLHQVADYLAASSDIQVCSFADIAAGKVALAA